MIDVDGTPTGKGHVTDGWMSSLHSYTVCPESSRGAWCVDDNENENVLGLLLRS